MRVNLALPSGISCSVASAPESTVRELKALAQQHFQRGVLRLAFGGQMLNPSSTLSEEGLREEDTVTAIVQPPQRLASTEQAFALHVDGGSACAWGNPKAGGDSGQVQEQLVRVRQIQATQFAFAAILDDGSVVTWGHPPSGGNGNQVREQLVRVKHIQATQRAFAAILADGSVVSWGDPRIGGDSSQAQQQLMGLADPSNCQCVCCPLG